MKEGSVTKYKVAGSSRPKWRYRLRLGRDADGNDIREGKGGFDKESAARKAMNDRLKEMERQRNQTPEPEAIPLQAWLTLWLDNYAVHTCQPKTLERYRQLVRYLDSPTQDVSVVAATPIHKLRHQQLEGALRALLHQPAKRREHISARTVRHVAGVIQVALNEAFRLDHIAVNPMLKVKLPSVEEKKAESLVAEQVRALRDACRGDWTFPFIEVASATGCRRGELLAFCWANIDWITGVVVNERSLEQTEAGLRLKKPKNGKERRFSLPQSALAALRFHRDQQAEHKRLFGADYQNLDLVFAAPDGDFLKPDLVSQTIIRRLRKAGIKSGSLHTLRHTHASHLLSKGVPLPAVSARLGHADSNVTARIYSHALPEDDRRAADTWDMVVTEKVQ